MWSVYKRMAALWAKHSDIEALTPDEMSELKICLDAHVNLARKLARLENLSFAASVSNDNDWMHEICAGIDDIQNKMIGLPTREETERMEKKAAKKKKKGDQKE